MDEILNKAKVKCVSDDGKRAVLADGSVIVAKSSGVGCCCACIAKSWPPLDDGTEGCIDLPCFNPSDPIIWVPETAADLSTLKIQADGFIGQTLPCTLELSERRGTFAWGVVVGLLLGLLVAIVAIG